ncbi:MarR family winged helix-turn-helix transcriptional regulator [Kribbella sp. NPDC003557]|uniref:MarR family winged helix-turn-helix transcriptional regulator n=1 Tax=Kribbella sp. NPDC003557 TaxID=3154449 RepID=UPI0033BB886E
MSRPQVRRPAHKPLIALVERANRALQTDLVRQAHARGHTEVKMTHNSVFATLHTGPGRAADMAARAGITRQSMGEVIRDMVALDLLEMLPDPNDRRAKVVTYSEHGMEVAGDGFSYLADLEDLFAEEFGEHEYAVVRDVLARLTDVLERHAAAGTQASSSAGGSVG